jgi:hypothetical protein
MILKGYEQVGNFSIPDLSWIGFYSLLLSICFKVFRYKINKDLSRNVKYILISIIAPIIIITESIILFKCGHSLFYTILYGLPTSFLSYYSLKYLIINDGSNKPFRIYNFSVLTLLIIDNISEISSHFNYSFYENCFDIIYALLLLILVPSTFSIVSSNKQSKIILDSENATQTENEVQAENAVQTEFDEGTECAEATEYGTECAVRTENEIRDEVNEHAIS